ncbi:unnamed protein product [Didymodactylos carnosus]|uniref:G-protein coupled receptors family 1 profile domain-containing protein n=1 Tax=Didymodactylos carnosus TaxID=1234261 RepID=A0A814FJJ2_9BILA|nr:unnamed protein product [Didymodactylos carnosus]CAF1285411.1 unnamed protein product [Didymodactylos carnosus]CAF3754023.1 unnamed protein product [Didymodactylos carnosus]CAF4090395.1 unnamed protein product [Didymodactylos carnosus]
MNNSSINLSIDVSRTCVNDYILLDFKRIVEGWILSCICLFGICGNLLTCIILSNSQMRGLSTNVYLLALSFVNTLVLIGFFLSHGLRSILYDYNLYCANIYSETLSTLYELFYARIFLFLFPTHITCILISIYLTAAVAIDRFVLICLPHKIQKCRTQQYSIKIIFGVSLFCIIYCLPFWFEFTNKENFTNTTNHSNKASQNERFIVMSEFGKRPLFRVLMRKYLYFIFVFLLPLFILIFCKACIIRRLITTHKKKRLLGTKTNKRNRSSNAITLLLLAIVFVFLITQFPYFIFNVLYSIQGPTYLSKASARLYLGINNVLAVINSSSAFILYSFFGKKFREMLVVIFCCKQISPDHSLCVSRQPHISRISVLSRISFISPSIKQSTPCASLPMNRKIKQNDLHKLTIDEEENGNTKPMLCEN